MTSILAKHRDAYVEEIQELLHRRAYAILWVGVILIPLFSILDYVVARDHFRQFLLWRILTSLFFIFSIFINFQDKQHRHPFAIVTIAIMVAAGTISAMIVQLGGYTSVYYVGLILVLVTYAAIFPLTMLQTASLGAVLLAFYAVPLLVFSSPSAPGLKVFFANMFFFVTFLVIIIVQSRAEDQSRQDEFNLRMSEKEISSKLSFYAEKLEDDVRKRTHELKESEKRYRDLYQNIIDDIILVDREGKILLANPRFYTSLALPEDDEQNPAFLDLLHPEDVNQTKTLLLDKLKQGENVTDIQFRMVGSNNRIIDVECNATIIKKEGVIVGFQMLIRDISKRKEMENKLIESFQTVQKTRSATILGLAKLSEYRDASTGKHLERIREFCMIIARELARQVKYSDYITDQFIEDLYHSSILHDIGKVGIADGILLKRGKLTAQESEIIKQHTSYGGNILKAVDAETAGQSFLSMAKSIAYFHHEKWDGSGYPYGLREEEIPLAARIVSLADVYDGLTSMQKYRAACPHRDAVKIISAEKGLHFAPDIVDAFLKHHPSFDEIRTKYTRQEGQHNSSAQPECYDSKKVPLENFIPDFPVTQT